MKNLAFVLLVPLTVICLAPVKVSADGMFVVPKFVWDGCSGFSHVDAPLNLALSNR